MELSIDLIIMSIRYLLISTYLQLSGQYWLRIERNILNKRIEENLSQTVHNVHCTSLFGIQLISEEE